MFPIFKHCGCCFLFAYEDLKEHFTCVNSEARGLFSGDMKATPLHNVNKNIKAAVRSHWCAPHNVPDGARTGREGVALPAILWQHPANCSHQAS